MRNGPSRCGKMEIERNASVAANSSDYGNE
jgi:hypothetical protein